MFWETSTTITTTTYSFHHVDSSLLPWCCFGQPSHSLLYLRLDSQFPILPFFSFVDSLLGLSLQFVFGRIGSLFSPFSWAWQNPQILGINTLSLSLFSRENQLNCYMIVVNFIKTKQLNYAIEDSLY